MRISTSERRKVKEKERSLICSDITLLSDLISKYGSCHTSLGLVFGISTTDRDQETHAVLLWRPCEASKLMPEWDQMENSQTPPPQSHFPPSQWYIQRMKVYYFDVAASINRVQEQKLAENHVQSPQSSLILFFPCESETWKWATNWSPTCLPLSYNVTIPVFSSSKLESCATFYAFISFMCNVMDICLTCAPTGKEFPSKHVCLPCQFPVIIISCLSVWLWKFERKPNRVKWWQKKIRSELNSDNVHFPLSFVQLSIFYICPTFPTFPMGRNELLQ